MSLEAAKRWAGTIELPPTEHPPAEPSHGPRSADLTELMRPTQNQAFTAPNCDGDLSGPPWQLICTECGAPFEARRRNAFTCSDGCRQRRSKRNRGLL